MQNVPSPTPAMPYRGARQSTHSILLLPATVLLWAATMVACGGPTPRECLAGEPRAIFRATDSTVLSYDFGAEGQSSIETVAFANGLLLAVEQSGCDTLVQDFTLAHDSLRGGFAAFLPQASATFYQLASLAPRLSTFSSYAQILTSVPPEGKSGAPVDLAPGLTVRLSALPTPGRNSWRVRFTQDLGAARAPR